MKNTHQHSNGDGKISRVNNPPKKMMKSYSKSVTPREGKSIVFQKGTTKYIYQFSSLNTYIYAQ